MGRRGRAKGAQQQAALGCIIHPRGRSATQTVRYSNSRQAAGRERDQIVIDAGSCVVEERREVV